MKKIDDGFTVRKTPPGTYTSFDPDGKPLITSATEHQCFHMTHFYLKGMQDGEFTSKSTSYAGVVAGKL
jgi:hypothetical protein